MIRCNHCGKLAPTGATNCQSCGMPLVNAGGGTGMAGQSQQQDLPAWLESLRAHDRPVTNDMGDHQPFSMAELVDENAMPSWMRLDQSKLNESSDTYPTVSPKTRSEAGSERQISPPSGFEASSLIDEKSLPSWMRGQDSGQSGAEQSLSANSLVQRESLPAWMQKLEPGGPSAPMQSVPTNNPMQPQPLPPWMQKPEPSGLSTPAQGMPTNNPIQSESLPPWMQRLESSGPSAPMQSIPTNNPIRSESLPPWMQRLESGGPSQALGGQANAQYGLPTDVQIPLSPTLENARTPQTPISMPPTYNYNQPEQVPTQGFSARDLVDQQSLPNWMTNPQQSGQQNPSWSVPMGSGFSAGELVDQQSLPTWLKNQQGQANSGPVPTMGGPVYRSEQGTAVGQGPSGSMGMPAANLSDMQASPSWMHQGEQGAKAGYAQGTQQPESSGMVAGSLVDMNSLPAWMRNADNTQFTQSDMIARSGQPQTQPRVPSRPRGEAGSQEQTEAAANAFASMLGVTASSPNLPRQPQTNLGVPQAQQQPPTNLGIPQAQQSAIPSWQSPQQPVVNQGPLAQQMPGAGAPSPARATSSGVFYQQSGGMGVPQTPSKITEQQQPRPMGIGDKSSAGPQAEGSKKKGFFDAIRDFFFK